MRVLSKIEQRQLEYVLMQDMDLTKFTVLLCLYTGIRIGEACALRWEHIRLDSGILEVRETMQRIQAPQNMASKTRIISHEYLLHIQHSSGHSREQQIHMKQKEAPL